MKQTFCLGVLIALCSPAFCRAAAPTLKEGDNAPSIQVGKWVQGDPIDGFENGKAYIVEFWATWCGPCKASIPHLNEIHLKYKEKGLVVIGQDCWEEDDSEVVPFVKKMGQKMTYRVALDSKEEPRKEGRQETDGKMTKTWMDASGNRSIPTAFVVNRHGVLAWVGHPFQLHDSIIEDILNDRHNIGQAALKRAELEALNSSFEKKVSEKDLEGASTILRQMESIDDDVMLGFKRLYLFMEKRDYNGAFALLEKQYPKANPATISAEAADAFNNYAWTIAVDTNATPSDLEMAFKMSERGVAASGGESTEILDSQARILFRQGKQAEAIQIQEKAVRLSTGKEKAALEKTLESYRKKELPKQ